MSTNISPEILAARLKGLADGAPVTRGDEGGYYDTYQNGDSIANRYVESFAHFGMDASSDISDRPDQDVSLTHTTQFDMSM